MHQSSSSPRRKGGSGKTTLAGHIAVEAELSGAGPVALIDTDPQGSLASWWNTRASAVPAFAQVSVSDLGRDIKALRDGGFRLIVIDTPPAATTSIAEVITHADLVVIPTRPSPHDLRAVGATVDIVEQQRKPLAFIVNAATPRTRITSETAVALSQHGTVAPVTLHHRVDFAASMIDGRTVGEVDRGSPSAKEVAALWVYLADRLRRVRADAATLIRPAFETELLTPIGASSAAAAPALDDVPEASREPHLTPSMPAAVPEAEAWTMHLADTTGDRSSTASDDEPWDGVERRKVDKGPPAGLEERRRPLAIFSRRRGIAHEQNPGKYK